MLQDCHGGGPVRASILSRELRPYWEPLPVAKKLEKTRKFDLVRHPRKSLELAGVEASRIGSDVKSSRTGGQPQVGRW